MILVQKLQDNCNESINLGDIDTITLERVCDWYEKRKFAQTKTLSNNFCIRTHRVFFINTVTLFKSNTLRN